MTIFMPRLAPRCAGWSRPGGAISSPAGDTARQSILLNIINEGDPYNGHHYEAAEAMAKYFHQNDPSHHMVTTSFWASFPNKEFWSNPLYADIDYVDLHAYISTGWGLTPPFSQRI